MENRLRFCILRHIFSEPANYAGVGLPMSCKGRCVPFPALPDTPWGGLP